MKALALALIAIFSLPCSRAVATPEQDFWAWFGKNEAALFDFEKDQDRIFKELSTEMKKVNGDLTFEFGPKENGKRDFVISAGGIQSSFPAVIALYNSSPKLDRWNFIKFRPRRPFVDNEIDFGGTKVSAKDIYFALDPEGSKVGITLFIKGYTATPDKSYEQIAYLFLDTALGEYDVETKVGAITVKDSGEDVKKTPLKDLPSAVDSYFQTASGH